LYRYSTLPLPVSIFQTAGILFCLLFSACEYTSENRLIFSHLVTGTDTLHYNNGIANVVNFEFINESDSVPVCFWAYPAKGVNYQNASTMLASVIDSNMTDEQRAIAIWKLVAQSGQHYPFDYNHQLQDHVDPIALVSFPYFLCGEKAGILANLAVLAGLPARNIVLEGHVVAEIKYNGTWHMFDADENCIFRNNRQQIASVEELHAHPDWISETNIEYALKNNFSGFNKYKAYIKNYRSSWADTSFLISNYTFPDNTVTLYPKDEVSFQLSSSSAWSGFFGNHLPFSTKGVLKRKLTAHQKNIRIINDSTILLNENFPYYIKTLRVSSAQALNTRVYFQYQNRETLKTQKQYLGDLSQSQTLCKKFNAPAGPDIYYRYALVFENLSRANADKITIEHEFEFNSITFPLNADGYNVILTDSSGKKSLLLKISER